MKKQRYIVEIEMPEGDYISAGWLKDLIQTDCDVEDESRKKVTVQEASFPSNLDEVVAEIRMPISYDSIEVDCYGGSEPVYSQEQMREMFKAGAEWMAGQGVTFETEVYESYTGKPFIEEITESFIPGDKVVVQIRKK